ncbi:MAG: 3-dehydroquinate synthase [Paenisporosarcina sp.]
MQNITIDTVTKQYDVHMGTNIIHEALSLYKQQFSSADHIIIIADETVANLHLDKLKTSLKTITDVNIHVFLVPSGESCKTIETYYDCHSFLMKKNCSRKSVLFAFGGGACGDLTGFVASTFMRGIPFYQIPTTILAHDSAVGGKTGINHQQGKNMIGTFYQPEAVFYDMSFLGTLPKKEVRSGMAEVIKHALISNPKWVNELFTIQDFSTLTPRDVQEHLCKGIRVKANIVKDDEFEHGSRKFLNFGHTYGHALENTLGYGQITHGEAVMIGIVYALMLSEEYAKLESGFAKKFLYHVVQLGYTFDAILTKRYEDLYEVMSHDKKASHGDIHFVLLNKIGEPVIKVISKEQGHLIDQRLKKWVEEV